MLWTHEEQPSESTTKKMFFFSESDQDRDTKKAQALSITFSQSDWFIPQIERFWLAITARKSYHKNSESSETTVIHENTTSTVQLLQIFIKQNYKSFAAKHTHWHLQWCSHGTSHLGRPKQWSLRQGTKSNSIEAGVTGTWTNNCWTRYQAVFISKLTCQFSSFLYKTLCKEGQLCENNDHTLQKQRQLWQRTSTALYE